ncbi:MAG: ABC transporter permease, partial [Chloroflexi bacterium]|nr:ABC transporter permease [Chloroflexota bacterium]
MTRYLLRRGLSSLVALFIFLTLFFFIAQIALPGDYFSQFLIPGPLRNLLRSEAGLDQPLVIQYLIWVQGLLTGDLGLSLRGTPVSEVIWNALPTTMIVFFVGGGIGFLTGFWLGKLTGWRKHSPLLDALTFGGIALYTSFPPWLAFMMAYLFAAQLKVFRLSPTIEMMQLGRWFELGRNVIEARLLLMMGVVLVLVIGVSAVLNKLLKWRVPPVLFIILPVVAALAGAYLWGFGDEAREAYLINGLPIVIFAILSFGEVMVIMQTNIRETLYEEYTTTARAKGLSERRIRDRHAAPNALIPVLSRTVISVPYLLSGLVIIEFALEIRGVGSLLFLSTLQQDFPVVMGILVLIGL